MFGRQPMPEGDDIHYASIPNAKVVIRVWGAGMETSHMYSLDFVDRDTLQHIRRPPSCQLYSIQSLDRWWLPRFRCGKVEMAEGLEMYQVFEGDSFMLSVDTDTKVELNIPVRPLHVKPDWLLGTTTIAFKRSVT
ncbi:uncharacterized protein LAESUDRAFT_809869 [Laetiporus sulphureus 93-53]|uniref:Uncharacterized protein n=1 Tax=Laetiporus sulphureus 93-53 TaxID=1314785 RepID=A0A165GZE7_9APHY|nr:uncharacterized protein LAESUDRAFT_809869 [Laetiporus sulphureus 93-53]KZT11038.1 hypothetical protein LAESUDRAFT_809869 [Laetiporus sulphureus 93-53]